MKRFLRNTGSWALRPLYLGAHHVPSTPASSGVTTWASAGVYDVAILGAGPGGYVAAIRAAQMGGRVLLVEKVRTRRDLPQLGLHSNQILPFGYQDPAKSEVFRCLHPWIRCFD